MSIQRIQPSKRFSEVVIHNNTAYFAGQVPEKTVKQNAYEQTKEVLSLNQFLPIIYRSVKGLLWFNR